MEPYDLHHWPVNEIAAVLDRDTLSPVMTTPVGLE